jgi:putative flippase GtrA
VIETSELYHRETFEAINAEQSDHNEKDVDYQPESGRKRTIGQVIRFGLVGIVNTVVDLLILNMLLLLFPTNSIRVVLIFSALAYGLGAVNSFLLNKYWTFGYRQRTTWREVVRFTVTTSCGIGWSSIILWLASNALHPILINPTVWANASKVVAISGTALISYLGMSLWVFVNRARKEHTQFNAPGASAPTPMRRGSMEFILEGQRLGFSSGNVQSSGFESKAEAVSSHSISVVMPAYNEEGIIAETVSSVLGVLHAWGMDFEILVVNDGSTDRTGEIVAALVDAHPRIRLVTHATNEGYGASLVSGFDAATKELLLFMDSDGQFDFRDLLEFFPLIDSYDAVIGYRVDRQDTWMRKLNAWGWKQLIGWVLGVHVRDVYCAFKLLRTEFLHRHPLETRGAMINAELLCRLKRAGCSYKEVGVMHLPRLYGQATGAKPSVVLRAFRELIVFARGWHRVEKQSTAQRTKRELPVRS